MDPGQLEVAPATERLPRQPRVGNGCEILRLGVEEMPPLQRWQWQQVRVHRHPMEAHRQEDPEGLGKSGEALEQLVIESRNAGTSTTNMESMERRIQSSGDGTICDYSLEALIETCAGARSTKRSNQPIIFKRRFLPAAKPTGLVEADFLSVLIFSESSKKSVKRRDIDCDFVNRGCSTQFACDIN